MWKFVLLTTAVATCIPAAFCGSIATATAMSSGGTNPDCSQTQSGAFVSVSCTASAPGAEAASAAATASASLLNLVVNVATGSGASGLGNLSARVDVFAQYAEEVYILGGSGAGEVSITYSAIHAPLDASQAGVSLDSCFVSSFTCTTPFTYGVPFEMVCRLLGKCSSSTYD